MTTTAPHSAAGDRVLVVVQLSGGNDGLNTLVPVTDGRYHDARPTLAVAEGDALALPGQDRLGLHPALAPLLPLWESGRVAALESIGYEESGRSHFAALDTWWTATPDHSLRTGWLGRWLDQTDPGDGDPLVAIALGSGSPALQVRAHGLDRHRLAAGVPADHAAEHRRRRPRRRVRRHGRSAGVRAQPGPGPARRAQRGVGRAHARSGDAGLGRPGSAHRRQTRRGRDPSRRGWRWRPTSSTWGWAPRSSW